MGKTGSEKFDGTVTPNKPTGQDYGKHNYEYSGKDYELLKKHSPVTATAMDWDEGEMSFNAPRVLKPAFAAGEKNQRMVKREFLTNGEHGDSHDKVSVVAQVVRTYATELTLDPQGDPDTIKKLFTNPPERLTVSMEELTQTECVFRVKLDPEIIEQQKESLWTFHDGEEQRRKAQDQQAWNRIPTAQPVKEEGLWMYCKNHPPRAQGADVNDI
jgi:hypothetical protein